MSTNVNIVMDEEAEELIQSIIRHTDAKTYKEVFIRAVNLYEWLLQRVDDGSDLVLIDKVSGQTLEVILPGTDLDKTPKQDDDDKSGMN